MWLKLDQHINNSFPPDVPQEQMRRFKGLKMQLGIYGQNILFTFFALPTIALLIPNFPPFATVILGKSYNLESTVGRGFEFVRMPSV